MKNSRFAWALLVLGSVLTLSLASADSSRVDLAGELVQGGLLIGQTHPAATVQLGDRLHRVSPDGKFLIGFGRDAPATAELSVRFPDGTTELRQLRIKQRQYQIQRIDGLPPKMVTPPQSVLSRIEREQKIIDAARYRDTPKAYFAGGFVWPVTGPISGVYGSQRVLNGIPKRPHFGVDIAVPTGTPVAAPADGIVVLAERGM